MNQPAMGQSFCTIVIQLPNCEQARNALATGGKQNIGEVIASVVGNLIKSAYSISIIN